MVLARPCRLPFGNGYGPLCVSGLPMLVIYEPIDVPIQERCPDLDDRENEQRVTQFVNYVLTHSLREAQVIEAEVMLGEKARTQWRSRIRNTREPLTVIAESPQDLFRTILAQVNVYLLDGQVYGPHRERASVWFLDPHCHWVADGSLNRELPLFSTPSPRQALPHIVGGTMDDARKAAYRHLRYVAMLTIRIQCQSGGIINHKPLAWYRQ